MKTYIVELKEVHMSSFEVEAENEEQAKEMVIGGDGDFTDSEYLYTLDDEEAKVTLKKE
jgi:hypothetical protein